jgi:hypothetical protein
LSSALYVALHCTHAGLVYTVIVIGDGSSAKVDIDTPNR